jgi:hypothetical protein
MRTIILCVKYTDYITNLSKLSLEFKNGNKTAMNIDFKKIGNLVVIFSIIFSLFFCLLRFLGSDKLGLNWDSPIFIDGAYRVFLGQIPHIDFSSPVGPIVFWAGGAGMYLTSPTLAGMNVGYLIYGAMIVTAGTFFLRNILNRAFLSAFILVESFFIFSPKMLHHDFLLGYTGMYNVWGYALLFFLGNFLFCDFRKNLSRQDLIIKGVVCSSIFVQMLLIKNSFAFVAFIFLLVWISKSNIKYFSQGFIFFSLIGGFALSIYFKFDLYPLIRDQEITILSRLSQHPFSNHDFLSAMIKNVGYDIMFIVFSSALLIYFIPDRRVFIIKMSLAYIFSGYLLCASIMQKPVFVLSNLFGFIVLVWLCHYFHIFKKLLFFTPILFVSALIFVIRLGYISAFPIFGSMSSFLNGSPNFDVVSSRKSLQGQISPFLNKNIADIDTTGLPPPGGQLSGGFSSVGINNLYNYYYLIEPPKNTLLYWHSGVTFTPELVEIMYFYAPVRILKDSEFLYLNSTFHNGKTVHDFLLVYGDYLNENFRLVARDGKESLYRRLPFSK